MNINIKDTDGAGILITQEYKRLLALKACADIAWREHHKKPRQSWGYASTHEALKSWRDDLDLQLHYLSCALEELKPGSVPGYEKIDE